MMSGSSVDGIDAALVRVTGCCEATRFDLVDFVCRDFSDDERRLVLDLFDYGSSTVDKVCLMNALLGELFADAVRQVLEQTRTRPADVDAVGVWPQMVYHLPARSNPQEIAGYRIGAALQLGDLNVVAERTGITAIGSFSARDIAAGGNGAPLTGLGDYVVYHHPERNRVVQNIGGIANANYVPAEGGLDAVTGFDTGPGNMVIDEVVRQVTGGVQQLDRDGEMARAGQVDRRLLDRLMLEPFIQASPPKAAGREQYGAHFAKQLIEGGRSQGLRDADLVATATALTVEAIATSYERFFLPRGPIDEVIVGGGGAYNPALLEMLRARVAPITVAIDEDYGISSFAKEAIYMALVTNEVIMGHPNNVPSVTGAVRPVTMGLIALAGTPAG